MQRWSGLQAVPGDWPRSAVTIGVFDGVHRGHRAVIADLLARARAAELAAVVVTFDPHPLEVVRPDAAPALLTTVEHRLELLAGLGVDATLVLSFTPELSRLTAEEFVQRVLVETLHAAEVVVGANFRFGHKAAGTVELLGLLGDEHGFAVEGLDLLPSAPGGAEPASSTYVRQAVASGDVARAAAALGRPHRIEGIVVEGDKRGRGLGYPTANLDPTPRASVPADGVYAGRLVVDSDRLPAAISIGTNPTFDGTERRVEAYALDRDDLELYGARVAIDFVDRLRDTLEFESAAALVTQIDRDIVDTRDRLRNGTPGGG